MMQLLTMMSTGSLTARFNSTIDPVVNFKTSLTIMLVLPNETLTGKCTPSRRSKVFDIDEGAGPADSGLLLEAGFAAAGAAPIHSTSTSALVGEMNTG